MKRAHWFNQQTSAVFLHKQMYDVRLFGKAVVEETGVLPVVRFLGFKALRNEPGIDDL